jgi:hypothetical protein
MRDSFEAALLRESAKEELSRLVRGGSPSWPIVVASASVIEARATSLPCAQCGGEYRVLEHTRPVPELRRLDVACRHCSTPRVLWFSIAPFETN